MNKVAVLLLVSAILLCCQAGVEAAIPVVERNALIALYTSAGGAAWTDNEGWLGVPGTECDWHGVVCDEAGRTVVELRLYNNNLVGTIPPELEDLSNLEVLYLCCQGLSGPIPPGLGDISTLRDFHAHNNQLDGSIPAELGDLSNLETLHLWSNDLSGQIPPELGNLSQLTSLAMCCNAFTGEIPAALGDLGLLENLYLYSNELTGTLPPELGQLGNLEIMALNGNSFDGSIPAAFGDLQSLRTLDLSWNDLSGGIPQAVASLPNLVRFELEGNGLTGQIPPQLGGASNLEIITLERNQLSGQIPPELGTLQQLEYLRLDHNRLDGQLPNELGNLMALRALRLNSNKLGGEIPTTLLNLMQLEEDGLDLRYNALYSNEESLISHLNAVHNGGDFRATQTVAPTDILLSDSQDDRVTLSWTPITYVEDDGHYQVSTANSIVGPWTVFGQTSGKGDSSMVITGLDPGLNYYFQVHTVTEPHGNNDNRVLSDGSAVVSGGISYWLEIAAHLPGQFGSQWRTDVVARNLGLMAADVTFTLNTSDGQFSFTNSIPASAQGVFQDVVGVMNYEGKGSLEVRSSQPLLVNARIYNQAEEGTIGQFIDAFTTAEGLVAGDEAWLLQLRQLEGVFRTNISLTNTGTEQAVVRVTLFRTDGTELFSYQRTLAPAELFQDAEPFSRRANEPDLGWGFARIEVISGHGVLASASVVDSVTNDATTIAMKRPPGLARKTSPDLAPNDQQERQSAKRVGN